MVEVGAHVLNLVSVKVCPNILANARQHSQKKPWRVRARPAAAHVQIRWLLLGALSLHSTSIDGGFCLCREPIPPQKEEKVEKGKKFDSFVYARDSQRGPKTHDQRAARLASMG